VAVDGGIICWQCSESLSTAPVVLGVGIKPLYLGIGVSSRGVSLAGVLRTLTR